MKSFVKNMVMSGTLVLVGAATGFWLFAGESVGESGRGTGKKVQVNVSEAPLKRDVGGHVSYAPVVKRTAPGVVNIFTTKKVVERRGGQMMPFFDDPVFRRFFGGQFGNRQFDDTPRTRVEQSLGSGVIVSADGYILTNDHVVDGADEIKVMLEKDRKEYLAKIVGRDPKTDIAVLKIDVAGLPALTFANSDWVEVGDVVLAIGNPFGVGQTVTSGIVSATGRGGMNIEDYEDFIQTDASINPGNSGGALIDVEGRLIGINTAILSRTGGNQGIGFAIPSNLARTVMDSIIQYGKVTRGYLGVSIQDITSDLAKEFKLKDAKGALVGDVAENSPAAEAGLKSGDIITEFGGKSVVDSRQLKLQVGSAAPGAKVDVRVLREGKEKTLKVTVKPLDEKSVALRHGSNPNMEADEVLKGVGVSDLNQTTRQQYNIPAGVRGAVITEVEQGTASFMAGLRPGMVLQEVNRQPVYNSEDAIRLTSKAQDRKTLVKIWSGGGSRFLVINEEKTP